ncbi:MAG: hypothetical protein AB7G93_21085 [Bdellovibrionales bacterium]
MTLLRAFSLLFLALSLPLLVQAAEFKNENLIDGLLQQLVQPVDGQQRQDLKKLSLIQGFRAGNFRTAFGQGPALCRILTGFGEEDSWNMIFRFDSTVEEGVFVGRLSGTEAGVVYLNDNTRLTHFRVIGTLKSSTITKSTNRPAWDQDGNLVVVRAPIPDGLSAMLVDGLGCSEE